MRRYASSFSYFSNAAPSEAKVSVGEGGACKTSSGALDSKVHTIFYCLCRTTRCLDPVSISRGLIERERQRKRRRKKLILSAYACGQGDLNFRLTGFLLSGSVRHYDTATCKGGLGDVEISLKGAAKGTASIRIALLNLYTYIYVCTYITHCILSYAAL